ncbi:hypothetical protein B0A49_13312, partial [Cryomyces minteri]
RPDLLQVNNTLEHHGSVARDFEQAIVDDDRSVRSGDETMFARRGSASPAVARKNTFRRAHHPHGEKIGRSRASSHSSRSESPPNSVDAFAEPRRRGRAGTVTSLAPSHVELTLQRTHSGGTHRRRPTFSEHNPNDAANDASSRHSSAEDDVCFPPPEESSKTYTIDFEELEEFVVETHKKTPVAHPLLRRYSISSQSKAKKLKVFNDLRPKPSSGSLPKVGTEGPGRLGSDVATDKAYESEEKSVDLLTGSNTGEGQGIELEPASRWSFFSSEFDESIHAADLGGLIMPGESFRDLFELGPEGGVWWLDMLNPSEEEVFAICKAFGVHPLTREDITTQETREKVELFRSYYFVCFRSFYQEDKQSEDFMEPINVYAVVFREGLLTFTFCHNPHASNVRKRIGRLRDYVNLSADWICYALIDDIVDAFGPVIHDIEIETDAIEDNVFTARAEDSRLILRQIGDCRKKVMSLLRLLGGKADVIKGFAKRCNEQYTVTPRGDVGLYLSDVQDHVVTMMSNLSHFEKMLSRSHSNYLAQISVDNIAQGNRANSTLGKVTLIATILVPLNLICGLFGMNVPVPGRESDGLGWFFGIVGVIVTFSLSCIIVAKRLRYF